MSEFDTASYVKRARAKLKMTQAELAESLGIERRTVMRYEQGDDLPHYMRLAIRQLVAVRARKMMKKKFDYVIENGAGTTLIETKKNGADHPIVADAKEQTKKPKRQAKASRRRR
jgi:DNA-binding XRE family transcriptional regulator